MLLGTWARSLSQAQLLCITFKNSPLWFRARAGSSFASALAWRGSQTGGSAEMCGRLQIAAKPEAALGSGTTNQSPRTASVPVPEAFPRGLATSEPVSEIQGGTRCVFGAHPAQSRGSKEPHRCQPLRPLQVPGSAQSGHTSGHAPAAPFLPYRALGARPFYPSRTV